MRKLLTALAILIAAVAFWYSGQRDVVRRAAFDIGSGSIKCVVADVNLHTGKVVKEHMRQSVKADFAENLAPQANRRIPPAMLAEGMALLLQLKTRAEQMGAEEFSAVTTEAFRAAQNGRAFTNRITREADIPARVIGVDEEARLGIVAAYASWKETQGPVAIWDIGGASMQLTLMDGEPTFFYAGKLGSIPFKNRIIREVQQRKAVSPNPMNYEQYLGALQLARTEAATLPDNIRETLSTGDVPVLGIGPVHNLSIVPQLGGRNPYTGQDLANAIEKNLNKTDHDLGGGFAPTQVGNLILVLGFMQELSIPEVQAVEVTLADGLLVSEEYWP